MAREGSVAPKERVNIVYKSHTGDAQEEVELPFRFLVVGDFTGREEETPIEQRTLMGVDKDNFDDVLAGQNVGADLTVPNKLTEESEEAEELSVSLKFENMKDFSPDSIVQQVPELKSLVDLRDALTMLKGPLGNMPTFRKQLQALMDDPEAQKKILDELKRLGGGGEE
jgi:type VI secretion system protein ImpB